MEGFFILWRGALLVEKGEMEAGDLFSFIIYTGIIGGAIAGIGNLYTVLAGAVGATERIQEILESGQEVQISSDRARNSLNLKGEIEFDKVAFSYPSRPDIEVLHNISFKVKPGMRVALVGSSGAGKSTIIQLLMKFYNPSSGRILVDGLDIENYNHVELRENIAIVPQEIILFGGSIYENILYGKPEASYEDVVEAAKQSYSLEFINSFPEKFETIVGERGIKLSGGQRQRIAIARAILRNPRILILDEATSSLDSESEQTVQIALDELMQNRTSIIIAHRLSTIKSADIIFVLKEGNIVEYGTHEELFEKQGFYAQLIEFQLNAQD